MVDLEQHCPRARIDRKDAAGLTLTSLRPSEFRQLARAGSKPEQEPTIELAECPEGGIDVIFVGPPPEGKGQLLDTPAAFRERILNVQPQLLTIFPINARPDKDDYLLPKYGALTRICITAPKSQGEYDLPEAAEDVVDLLESLPEGFSKKFQFGLGLHWEYRFICEAVAEIPGVTTLFVHGEAGQDDALIDPPFYMLGTRRFRSLRKELARIAARYQRESRSDKRLVVYDDLLHAADAKQFPRKSKKLRPDTIADLIGMRTSQTTLSLRDQKAVVKLVNENAEALAKSSPSTLLELKSDIERITLKELIERFEEMLAKNHPERIWQMFFQSNPFILSMAFAVPAMLIQENPYIGGTRFTRNGGKIADFLLATATTGNLAVIEIKKPGLDLLAKKPYREGIHGLSSDLGGTVAQVLDQRFQLQKNILSLKEESRRPDIHAYAVRCIVIAGRSPTDPSHRKSLELARNSLVEVTVVTFDELLARLTEIHSALSPVSQVPDPPF